MLYLIFGRFLTVDWSTNPDKVKILSNHDEYGAGITELVATFERWKYLEEVMCFFVYSSLDRQVRMLCLFSVVGRGPEFIALYKQMC